MKLNIPTRSAACSTGHPFEDNDHLVSELFKTDDGTWIRKDTCEKCYKKDAGAYCTWHSSLQHKKPEPTDLLESFRAQQDSDPRELSFLAEILLRQKQLIRRSRSKEELVVEDAASGDLFYLPRFDLSLSEVRHFSMKYVEEE